MPQTNSGPVYSCMKMPVRLGIADPRSACHESSPVLYVCFLLQLTVVVIILPNTPLGKFYDIGVDSIVRKEVKSHCEMQDTWRGSSLLQVNESIHFGAACYLQCGRKA